MAHSVNISPEQQIETAVRIAKQNAFLAAQKYFAEQLNRNHAWPCGFAWVYTVAHGNSTLVKHLKNQGFYKQHPIGYALWNPSGLPVQNMDTLHVGAAAAAETLTQLLGVKFYADCRMD